jgi:type I restriction enzyme, S subunit
MNADLTVGRVPTRFRPYAVSKDSGVEWLGEIPELWEVKRLKALLSRNDSGVWGEDFDDEGVIVLRSTEQTIDGRWHIDSPAKRRLTAREASEARLEIADLVVTKSSGSELHIGKTTIVDPPVAALNCCFSNFMQRLRVAQPHQARYLWYLLNSPVAREQLVFLSSTTTGLGNLNGSVLGAIQVPVSSEAEQRTIAAFLDRETAKIDALVAKKERLIDLLQEKRTALISKAVANGLDASVPTKDSRVETLGEIPPHWNVKRLWHLTPSQRRIMYGIVLPGPNVDEGVPIVKGGNVSPEGLRLEQLSRTTFEIEAGYARSRLKGGDLVYAIRGSIGEVAVVPDELEGANLTQDAARVAYTGESHGKWLLYALRSARVFAQLEAGALGATIRGINIRDLKRALLPVPPKSEQVAIADFLDEKSDEIDQLLSEVQNAVARLREFRAALISAAVTGKIDVREEAT